MERFWNKVKKGEADECWPWQANIKAGGYGQFALTHDRPEYAHRMAYILSKGTIPDNKVVRHTCDNPRCCNPNHLLLGSHQDNMDDRAERERQARGVTNGSHKLTEAQILEIRAAEGTLRAIAKRFGIAFSHVNRIKKGTSWAHLK